MTPLTPMQPATAFDTRLYGIVDRPAVIMVGVWDPLGVEHQALLSEMVVYARSRGLAAVTVLLDPAPPQFLLNEPWPIFEPASIRIERMRQLGIDGTVVVAFTAQHLATSAALFLASVSQHVTIAELWLGARQVFGRRGPGSLEAILAVAQTSGFDVRQLERETELKRKGLQVRLRLASGCVAATRELVGYAPVFARGDGVLSLIAWAPGLYQVRLLDGLDSPCEGRPVHRLLLTPATRGYCQFKWPAPQAPYLEFVGGPYDLNQTRWQGDPARLRARQGVMVAR